MFSAIALDQAHEQLNAHVKADGGAVGIVENNNNAALRRWSLFGPEAARLIKEYEQEESVPNTELGHHEHVISVQKAFQKDVKSLVETTEEKGSPFLDDTKELYSLDTHEVFSSEVVKSIYKLDQYGNDS